MSIIKIDILRTYIAIRIIIVIFLLVYFTIHSLPSSLLELYAQECLLYLLPGSCQDPVLTYELRSMYLSINYSNITIDHIFILVHNCRIKNGAPPRFPRCDDGRLPSAKRCDPQRNE